MEIEFLSAGFSNWLTVKPRELRAGAARALRRTGTAVQSSAIDLFRSRGVGRRIFGAKPAGVRKLITRSRLRTRHGVLEQPITMKGLAAIQEKGGSIGAHEIRAKNKKSLAFQWTGGSFFARSVWHDATRYPAIPYANRAVAMNVGKLREEIDKELASIMGGKKAA